jgi:hypothetical protein
MAAAPRTSPRADAARTTRPAGADVVGIRPDPVVLAPQLRAAAGYRVDGPDGRVGVLCGVAPAEPTAPPERLLVSIGLFIVTTVSIGVADVRAVDVERRRIVVATTPRPWRRSAGGLARLVHRFHAAAAIRAAGDDTSVPPRRQT